MKPNRLAAFGLAAGLFAGGAAGFAFGVPTLAGAQTDESTTDTTTPEKGRWMRDALAPLVEDGTINQNQADAVIGALDAARPARHPHRGHGFRGGPGTLEAAAGALGMTVEELRAAVRGGQNLAEVAEDKGVDPEQVVAAVVTDMQARIAEKVEAGRLTQEQADRILAELTERARAFVNGEAPGLGGPGFGRHGRHRGGFPPPAEGSSAEPAAEPASA